MKRQSSTARAKRSVSIPNASRNPSRYVQLSKANAFSSCIAVRSTVSIRLAWVSLSRARFWSIHNAAFKVVRRCLKLNKESPPPGIFFSDPANISRAPFTNANILCSASFNKKSGSVPPAVWGRLFKRKAK